MHLRDFALRDAGAVTIDWTVIAVCMIAMVLAVGSVIRAGLGGLGATTLSTIGGVHMLSAEDRLISVEDFERAAVGWLPDDTDDTAHGFGGVLGRFGGSGGAQMLTKTFQVDQDRDYVLVEFDLHAIDDWALEEIIIFANGQPLARRSFSTRPEMILDQDYTVHDLPGYRVEASIRPNAQRDRGYATGSAATEDQTMRVRIVAETPGPTFVLGFGSTLERPVASASWAIDNLRALSTNTPPD